MSSVETIIPFESVDKFGGTSMARPWVVSDIVDHHLPQDGIIVVSAPGKDTERGINLKMTDQLIEYADTQDTAIRDEIIDRLDNLYDTLPEKDRTELNDAVFRELTPVRHFGSSGNHDVSYYASRGELFSALYFARTIGAKVVDPAVVFTGAGHLDRDQTAEAIKRQVHNERGRLVVPGFYGEDQYRRTWTLDRGGSDRTGALISAALNIDYTNWTDVDGIFSADPRKIPEAKVIRSLTREEVREGAHGGSGVFQGDSIVDLNGSSATATVRNTFRLSEPGTRIVAHSDILDDREQKVVSVTGRSDLLRIGIRDLGMAQKRGYVAELLGEFARFGLSLEQMPTAQDSISLTLAGGTTPETEEFIDFAHGHRLSDQADVTVEKQGVVYLVGEALRQPRASREILRHALQIADELDIEEALPVMNEGAPSIAFVTRPEETDRYVANLHYNLIG